MFGLNDIGRFANTETDETVADHNILHAEQQFNFCRQLTVIDATVYQLVFLWMIPS